ncbi:twin-arginine translocation pathway signal protein [Tateyamaria sp. ANG-S1]|uniref:Acg family FMN-binding oxidoreductase n=1 Tax=Tateyamaria sp. ANG-S1 TaxID=1577905 RepID=UPI00057E076B|nr:twin-arginine translocation pathway signal protein [Tateyamaria sp. ANG-S1]KIC51425.1 twin-arginine translocation pathway signal protein [Tateyamaria sp. ANG-S1]
MPFTRRKTLALLGGGSILAASGAGAYAVTRMPRTALKPWEAAGTYAEPRMRALSYAILAPNPHNRQPWQVDLRTDGEVTLRVDTDRLLPHTDPFSRQIVVGLGCFLELMVLAAAEEGIGVELDVFPDGEDAAALDSRRVAVARFTPGAAAPSPLFDHVMDRRSLKEPYDTAQPVSQEALERIVAPVIHGSGVAATNDPDRVTTLRLLTARAFEIEFETPRTYKESVDLFRIGHREVDANPDGIDFSGPQFEALRLTGLFSRAAAMDPGGMSYKQGLEMVTATAMTGMAYVWLTTDGNSRADQIIAGRDWLRLNLATTAAGLGMQPMSQPLQEFPEMAGLYDEAHAMLAPGGQTVQMLGRLGYGTAVPQSPRWGLESKIVHG